MKDKGINSGLVQTFETSNKRTRHAYWGWRKMFWDYLTKLHVPFFDACCEDASGSVYVPVRFNTLTGETEYYDSGTDSWIQTDSFVATTTTTTAAPTTTTTTTAAPTTTTTTTIP